MVGKEDEMIRYPRGGGRAELQGILVLVDLQLRIGNIVRREITERMKGRGGRPRTAVPRRGGVLRTG